ncbi:MAG TPA: hypothetical protein VGM90_06430 [Kofleriaceae bacterium]
MRFLAAIALAVTSGCIGWSHRTTAGVSHGKVDHAYVEETVGLDARRLDEPSAGESAVFVFWGIGGRVARQFQDGSVRGGPLTAFGVSYFRGRYGVVGLGAVGGALSRDKSDVFTRFQVGVEVEAGQSDWRLIEQPPSTCAGYTETRPKSANRTHFMFGLLPGVEYTGSEGASVSLSASFREIVEPSPCDAVGP